jgi:hypothetical protein
MHENTSEAALALAALTICQNLIAVLMDRGLLTAVDVEELLADAISVESEANLEAGDVIREVMDGLIEHRH